MRVIIDGLVNKPEKEGVCAQCDTVFAFTLEECNLFESLKERSYFINCPKCESSFKFDDFNKLNEPRNN